MSPSKKPAGAAAKRGRQRPNLLNYPRHGKTGVMRWVPTVRLVLIGVLSMLFIAVAGFTIGYAVTDVPEPNPEAAGETSTVYFDDGETVLGTFSEQNRVLVDIDGISEPMRAATVAAEDRSFYENRGISFTGLSRAVWGVVTDDYAGGGSTITQQYVKNFYLTNDHSLERKIREMFIALKIDEQQTKDEILANYLNTIYLGRQNYGIEVAAQDYFGKPASELDLAESALMAAMIQRPGAADPAVEPEVYEERFRYVLSGMVREGYITQAEADAAELPEVQPRSADANQYKGPNGYLLQTVKDYLIYQLGYEEDYLNRAGLEITSTFSADAMRAAEEAVADLPEPKPDGFQVAMSTIDPDTGAVKMLYGGEDYLERQQNAATQDVAQAGSAFKPFTLVAGFENGIRLTDYYDGRSPMSPTGWGGPVQNYGNQSYGTVTLLRATQQSMNTPYAQLSLQVGPEATADVAARAGIPEEAMEAQRETPSIVLGTPSPTNLQMASAYATFAANGSYRQPYSVERVLDTEGEVLHEAEHEGDQRFDEAVMAETSYALSQVVQGGTGSYASNLGRPVAGKTGTSQSNQSAWFVGYTPQLSTAVSMYRQNEAGQPIPIGAYGGRSSITGGSFPVQLWTQYMADVLEGEPVEQFPARGELPQVERPANPDQPAPPQRNRTGSGSGGQESRPEETEAPEPEGDDEGEGSGDDEGGNGSEGGDDGSGDSGGNGNNEGGGGGPTQQPTQPPNPQPTAPNPQLPDLPDNGIGGD
ncbi:transglycosylase domain-containing protein [Sediminivirga luteola]|uniref:Carboxypeptidase n=1 Tax=Sediminivirga luteola TaxID=1774748 RepID=A0A8J2XJJ2_9MICO|nr:transglycosylase domain-containing protein [Sediminivirga luteola]GGA20304.1 carboxypeptidase [Sediminivirga luteola]